MSFRESNHTLLHLRNSVRGMQFLNHQEKSVIHSPTLNHAGWLCKTLTRDMYCSWGSAVIDYVSSRKAPFTQWSSQQPCLVNWIRVIIFILEPGKFKLQKTMGYSRYMKPNYKEIATISDILTFNPEFLSNNLLLKMKTDSTLSTTQSVALGINFIFFLHRHRVVHLQRLIMYFIKVWVTLVAGS